MSNKMDTNTLLIELGTEELPPKSLKILTESFSQFFSTEIKKLGFKFDEVHSFGAPRRLGVALVNCQRKQADQEVEKRGPSVNAAFDENGEPTKAALGWARGNGIDIKDAQRLKTDKGEWLLHRATEQGKTLDEVLQTALQITLKQLPIPKMMRWGNSNSEFIRPVHTVCAMFGKEIISSLSLFGISAGNEVSGHRFHGKKRIELAHADDYAKALKEEFVLVDYQSRMNAIEEQLKAKASDLGLIPDYSQELLEEISSLVEWPIVLEAEFEERFLSVPKEALIYTMKDDQKYVPLLDQNGQLAPKFLFVSNIDSKDPSQVIAGNEKVIRPRLSDAMFFFETDKKTSLEDKSERLNSILFQKELGSVQDKSQRVKGLAKALATELNYDSELVNDVQRAATLAKADLVSNMVMEFPSVQGIMGYYYALHDGETEMVAQAIQEQYLPRYSGDELPKSKVGMLLSMAEKLDTLVGIFGINKLPKGDKDPFALRRAAIGLIRILVDYDLPLSIKFILSASIKQYKVDLKNQDAAIQLEAFLLDRLKPYYAEQDIGSDVVNAVLASYLGQSLSDINSRVLAVNEFSKLEGNAGLVAANKRVSNILSKNKIDASEVLSINPELFELDDEKALYSALESISENADSLTNNKQYTALLQELSTLRDVLDAFFDSVMIMADDEQIKHNRIALVSKVRSLFLSVADISLLNN